VILFSLKAGVQPLSQNMQHAVFTAK